MTFASKKSDAGKTKLVTVYEVECWKKYNVLTDDVTAHKEFSNCKCSIM